MFLLIHVCLNSKIKSMPKFVDLYHGFGIIFHSVFKPISVPCNGPERLQLWVINFKTFRLVNIYCPLTFLETLEEQFTASFVLVGDLNAQKNLQLLNTGEVTKLTPPG